MKRRRIFLCESESDSDSDVVITAIERVKKDNSGICDLVVKSESVSSDDEELAIISPLKSPIKKPKLYSGGSPDDYLHDNPDLPIYCKVFKLLSTERSINILLDPDLEPEFICKSVPISVNCNSVFLVDMSNLSDPRDIMCDDMGSWKWGGSYRMWLEVDDGGDVKVLGKDLPEKKADSHLCFRIWKRYYDNKSSPDVKKLVITIEDEFMHTHNFALIQYLFSGEEHDVKVAPHGNFCKSESYQRTKPSVLNKLRKAASENTAKRALSFVTSEAGGVIEASSASSLPRGRQQANDLRRGLTSKSSDDALYSVMVMCKEGEGSKSPDAFVRLVSAAPYPMMMLAFDWMLDDLVRFCTQPNNYSILGVDATFNLGAFDVTVTTYHHLLLTTNVKVVKHPAFVGPLFIHIKKDFAAYHFFASSLVSKRPELQNLQCFGSDGESALVNAFSAVFSKASHLRCFLHFRGNVERKLRELQISPATMKEFIRDIFGNPSLLQHGLVDALNEAELLNMFSKVEDKWNEYEKPFNSPPLFYKWFSEHGIEVIAKSMLRPLRENAGLGSPPEPYYTNDIESKNNILKQHLNRKASQLPQFVESMKELLQGQYEEVKNAVAGCGEYRVVAQYSFLAFDQQKWYKMSPKQRSNKVAQFMKATVCSATPSASVERSEVCSDNPLLALGLPTHMVETIWNRSQALVNEDKSIVLAPGDELAYFVRSVSGKRPHYVQPSKAGGYVCDEQCLGYKSAKLCAHIVAVAMKSDAIPSFLRWYRSLKAKPNFSALAEHGKPASAGQKPRKGVSKKGSKQVQNIVLNSSEEEFSSRILDESWEGPSSSIRYTQQSLNAPDSPSSSPVSPLVTLSNSPISVNHYGHQNFGQHTPGPPPLLQVSSVQAPLAASEQRSPVYSPGVPMEARPLVQTQFWLCFVRGNISRCNGCKGKIGRSEGNKPLPPPDDLVFRHKENVIFQNPHTGIFQQSREPRNVYYHAWKTCIAPHFLNFSSSQIQIDPSIRAQLNSVHLRHLLQEFGI